MTLVIAHKSNNHISLSSDSRITFEKSGYIDFGVKVFSVPVKIYSPTCSETGINTLEYNYNIGLAVVGSAMNAYIVKESVYEFLQNLQYMPDRTSLSMDGIVRLIFKVYQKTSLDLGQILCEKGMCQLIFTGYCPKQKKIRVFKFSTKIEKFPIEPFFEEILQSDGIEFFGTGKNEAEKIFQDNFSLQNYKESIPLHIIRKVIQEGNIESVGGGLQYGEFNIDNKFKIYGIEDYELNPDGSFKGYLYKLRGINLYKDEFEQGYDDFHIAYLFKCPFQDEINNLLKYPMNEPQILGYADANPTYK
ncbi:MAG: hypothetical protein ACR65R_18840 [Methylomicrobium sp.]